jgi:hypothetical protein
MRQEIMALSVLVRTFTGTVLRSSTDSGLHAICVLARERGLPLLGHIDPYDNTIFNRMQAEVIRSELGSLTKISGPEYKASLEGLIDLVNLVVERPHRYLVFNGD